MVLLASPGPSQDLFCAVFGATGHAASGGCERSGLTRPATAVRRGVVRQHSRPGPELWLGPYSAAPDGLLCTIVTRPPGAHLPSEASSTSRLNMLLVRRGQRWELSLDRAAHRVRNALLRSIYRLSPIGHVPFRAGHF